MTEAAIPKRALAGQSPQGETVKPNLLDYDATRKSFSWDAAQSQLAGLPGGKGLNIAWEAIGKHLAAREQVDLDSMDFLNLITSLCEHFKIEIPEKDYADLTSDQLQRLRRVFFHQNASRLDGIISDFFGRSEMPGQLTDVPEELRRSMKPTQVN